MKAGFAKVDITPRIGVELCGFGPYLNRHSTAVRDRLNAKAFAVDLDGKKIVLASCDLIGLQGDTINKIKSIVRDASGLPESTVMIHCTHTHSGPATAEMNGWGVMDMPYMEILPYKIADACIKALENMQKVEISYAEVPCEGIGLNRQYDKDAPPLQEVLAENWRPAKPELTDTSCHVIKAESDGRIIGFLVYFGCHPVVCCQQCHYIHGDFPGVALNNLEREFPGSTGIFLQGAQGDVNSCVVHKPEQDSIAALDVIAERFARSVREGLKRAVPIVVDKLNSVLVRKKLSELNIPHDELKKMLAEKEELLHHADGNDEAYESRMAMVWIKAVRQIVSHIEKGEATYPESVIQGLRLGPIALLGAPFEIFQAIKNDVKKNAKSPVPLVMSLTNDYLGYAPDKETAEGYAAKTVPMILGHLPFKKIHEELVDFLLEVDAELFR